MMALLTLICQANTKPNWNPIASAIIDNLVANPLKLKGKEAPILSAVTVATNSAVAKNVVCSSASSSTSRSTFSTMSTVVSPSSKASSETTSIKLHKMTEQDKQKVNEMYAGLDRKKLWKLKTGTIVEDKMKQLASSLDYEHPSHSMILDITDSCWTKVFEPNEWQEIRDHKTVEMPSSCFDFGNLECISGEKSSRASADASNSSRSLSDLTRQSTGRKMDYLFISKKIEYELGYGECALISGVNTTKELYDSCF
ncbi:Chitinase 2 [Mucor velutinosus]|uniref:Chitinase 2 n=1 Tax=Mucor velutinosus TaxID=708070 RepID=A0AAN7I083_9FUNG|nr:Chitinase 2 [Mucor velutinosus]